MCVFVVVVAKTLLPLLFNIIIIFMSWHFHCTFQNTLKLHRLLMWFLSLFGVWFFFCSFFNVQMYLGEYTYYIETFPFRHFNFNLFFIDIYSYSNGLFKWMETDQLSHSIQNAMQKPNERNNFIDKTKLHNRNNKIWEKT